METGVLQLQVRSCGTASQLGLTVLKSRLISLLTYLSTKTILALNSGGFIVTNESSTSDREADVPRTDRLGGNSWQRRRRLTHPPEERERERESLMHSAHCYVMSVCPSLAHWYCVVTVRHTVKIISVFFKTKWGFKIQTGSLPNGGVKCR